MDKEDLQQERLFQGGFYLIPNFFTLAALFFAFVAITTAINGRYDYAGWSILASLLLDGMDGRVARLMGQQGAFGEQLDSIADMVSFGLAPALIIYMALLKPLGKFGFMVAFIYCGCAAIRLALFNTLIGVLDKKWFWGLPSPSAASILAGFVWLWYSGVDDFAYLKFYDLLSLNLAGNSNIQWISVMAVVITLFSGISMIVPIKFWSFKGVDNSKVQNYNNWFILIIILLLFATHPPLIFFAFFTLYTIIGYILAVRRYIKGSRGFPI